MNIPAIPSRKYETSPRELFVYDRMCRRDRYVYEKLRDIWAYGMQDDSEDYNKLMIKIQDLIKEIEESTPQ